LAAAEKSPQFMGETHGMDVTNMLIRVTTRMHATYTNQPYAKHKQQFVTSYRIGQGVDQAVVSLNQIPGISSI